MSWVYGKFKYEKIAREQTPVARLTTKDAWIWRAIASILLVLSFGKFTRRRFLEDFATSLGPLQAYPRSWPRLNARTVVHEAGHTRQFEVAGYFVPVLGLLGRRVRAWVGILPMALVYCLLPLPFGFAYFRYRLELAADVRSYRWGLETGQMDAAEVRRRARAFAETVSSWAYLKPWPRKWTIRGFERAAERVITEWESKKIA